MESTRLGSKKTGGIDKGADAPALALCRCWKLPSRHTTSESLTDDRGV
jgi:hypothetical protein